MDSAPRTSKATLSPTSSTLKFKVEQRVSNPRRGPLGIKRSIDPNGQFLIARKYGEGTKPLFDRSDIVVNKEASSKQTSNKRKYRNSSSSSSSPINKSGPSESRYRDKSTSPEISTKSKKRNHSSNESHHYKTNSEKRQRSPEVPYYRDHKREEDRVRRKTQSRSADRPRGRSRSRSRSRSSSYRSYYRKNRSPSTRSDRSHSHNSTCGNMCPGNHIIQYEIPCNYPYMPPPIPFAAPPRFPPAIPMMRPYLPIPPPMYYPPRLRFPSYWNRNPRPSKFYNCNNRGGPLQ